MRVLLRANWFCDGIRYRRGEHDFPPELAAKLPSSAKVLEEEPSVTKPVSKPKE